MEGQLEKGGVFSNPTLGARVSGAKLCTCQRDLSLKVDCYLQWLPANFNHNKRRITITIAIATKSTKLPAELFIAS